LQSVVVTDSRLQAFLYGDAMPPPVDALVEDQLDLTAKRHLEVMNRRRYRAYVVAEMAHTSRRSSEKGPVAAAMTSFLYQQPGLNGPGASDKLWEMFAVDLGLAKSKSHFVATVQALIDVRMRTGPCARSPRLTPPTRATACRFDPPAASAGVTLHFNKHPNVRINVASSNCN